jgi:hypothetical protein
MPAVRDSRNAREVQVTLQIDHRRRARRVVRNDLMDAGLDFEQAEHWCVRWEREAGRRRVAPGPYFWDSGRGWIDAQLEAVGQARRQAG